MKYPESSRQAYLVCHTTALKGETCKKNRLSKLYENSALLEPPNRLQCKAVFALIYKLAKQAEIYDRPPIYSGLDELTILSWLLSSAWEL